jgi:hypothetical protein
MKSDSIMAKKGRTAEEHGLITETSLDQQCKTCSVLFGDAIR